MDKSRKLLPKILNGEKTIESRWYKYRRAPWGNIKKNDNIYFKDSGKPVTVKASVKKVLQFGNVNPKMVFRIIERYGGTPGICLEDSEKSRKSLLTSKYCLLIFLKNVKEIKPFDINKSGFGLMSAWLIVDNIDLIRKPS